MSDFQDFLKRALAYVAIGEFKPGKFEQARHLYEEAVATYGEGFKGAYLLQEPGTDKGISVIFWEGADEMQASSNENYQSILKEMNPLFAGAPQTSVYELVCEITPPTPEDDSPMA